MKRVLVIGCPGSGKSTFARNLAKITGLPLHYLDMIWHRPNKTTVSRDEFDDKLDELLDEDEWILDGNYLRTLPLRLLYADTVYLFELPVEECLAGAMERLGKQREDMPWHEDTLDEDFRQWILDFPENQMPIIELLLHHFKGTVIRFPSRSLADDYINSLTISTKNQITNP